MDHKNDGTRVTAARSSLVASSLLASGVSSASGAAAGQPVTERVPAAGTADGDGDIGKTSAVALHLRDKCPGRPPAASAEPEELQELVICTAAASLTSAPAALGAAERTQQRGDRMITDPFTTVDDVRSSSVVSKAVDVKVVSATPVPRDSASAEARALSDATPRFHVISGGDTDTPPRADAALLTGSAPVSRVMNLTQTLALCTPAAGASAPVRIAILPPNAGQEDVLPPPLISPVAAQSPAAATPPAVTCSPAGARPPKGAAVVSLRNFAAAPALQVPSRCYSLFPPRSSKSICDQLSPAQTTTSRSPVSNHSPGVQTPRQQPDEEYNRQQKALWQHGHEQDPLLPERALQQLHPGTQSPHGIGVAGAPAEPDAACVEDGDSQKEEQLQQQLQQLHHNLLAQLAASSSPTATVGAVSSPAEMATAAAFGSTAGAVDAIGVPPGGIHAASPSWTASECPAAAGGATVATSSRQSVEYPVAQESCDKQLLQSSTGDGGAFIFSATEAAASASRMSRRMLPGTPDSASPGVEQRDQGLQHPQGQQQETEMQQQRQEVHFSTLFQTVSAASVPVRGTACNDEAAERKSSPNLLHSDDARLSSSIKINCRLPMSLPSPEGTSERGTPAETHTAVRRETARGCEALARYQTALQVPWEKRPSIGFRGQRDGRKRHSVAGTFVRKTAAAALTAAALELGDSEKERHDGVLPSICDGSGNGTRGFGDCSDTCSSGSYLGNSLFRQNSSNLSMRGDAGFEKSRNSRSYGDLSSIDKANNMTCLDFSSSRSNSKRQELQGQKDCSTGSWNPAIVAETPGRYDRRDPVAVISDKERAALRAALLLRQDCLQRFLQATQQALSALEDNAENTADPGQLLSILGSSTTLQSSNPDNLCALPGPACVSPSSSFETSGPRNGRVAGNCLSRTGERVAQQEKWIPQPQVQGGETDLKSFHLFDTALPRAGVSPSLPADGGSVSSSLEMEGTAPYLTKVGLTPGGSPRGQTGAGQVAREREGKEHLEILANADDNRGRAILSGRDSIQRPPRDLNEAAAAAAAAAAAKAVAAAAASLLGDQRQQVQQQQIQQRVQPQQSLENQDVQQNREQPCVVAALRNSSEVEGEETGNEYAQCLCEVANLSPTRPRGTLPNTNNWSSCAPPDTDGAAADDDCQGSPASPASFGGRGGLRSKTAPAFSLDDKTMRDFLSFLSGEQEGDFSAADACAAFFLHRQGESANRAAQAPYTYQPGANRAAVMEALAAVMRSRGYVASPTDGSERRERPRVRFQDHRSVQEEGELDQQRGGLEHHELFSRGRQSLQRPRRIHPQQHQDTDSQLQQQEDVCAQSANQARTQLHHTLQLQQCKDTSQAASVGRASPSPFPSLKMSRDEFFDVLAAAAGAAGEKCQQRVTFTPSNLARSAAEAATQYENTHMQRHFEAQDILPGGPFSDRYAGSQSSSSDNARRLALSSCVSPWTAVSAPLDSQQRQQQREIVGFTPSSPVVRPLLLPIGEGIASAFEQRQQMRNSASLFKRPQRRTATLPCTAANVLFQSMDMQALLHLQCRCKPCAFYYNRKGCRNGMNCEFCHHEDHSRLTVKQWKKQQHKLTRQVRCLSVEEERAIAGVAGGGFDARSGDMVSLFGASRPQVVSPLPIPCHSRRTATHAGAFSLTWEGENSSSGRGGALPLRSGESGSNGECSSFLDVKRDISSTRCTDGKVTGCHVQSKGDGGLPLKTGMQFGGSVEAENT